MKDVGTFIRSRRLELGLTMQQVGDYCGVSKSSVCRWQSGDISSMKRSKIALLAQVLKIEPMDLVNMDVNPGKEPIVDDLTKRIMNLSKSDRQRVMDFIAGIESSHK